MPTRRLPARRRSRRRLHSRQQQIEAEAAARQKQAGEILAQLAATAGSVADLDRKTADADAAILAAMELEKERLTKTKEELAQLTDVVNELDALLAQTQAQLTRCQTSIPPITTSRGRPWLI